jgi:hypothetical protein
MGLADTGRGILRGRKRVRFVHVAPWPGYKAGACNLVLRRYTDPRAEIIGLVDADDIVQPHYLRETAGYFSDPSLGFLQTFEGNREFQGSHYYTACVDSFQAFYLSVMSSRNERDTVPFVGTMGLFRRSALTAVGGWNEWCICEDTEASLRVLRDGWSGLYIPRCFGRGVVPPSFKGMLTQRHRWCFGGMQIMRLHWRSLMPWDRSPDNHLTSAQRRDYLMASVGWFRDLLMLAFSLLLLAITGLLATESGFAVSPMDGGRSLLPLSLIIIATICMLWTLRQATVYLCGPIASVWNLWAVGVPAPEYQERFEKRRLRADRRRRSWARLPRPATAGAALTALCAGGVASAFLAPSLAFRTPGLNGRPTTESVDTFGTAAVAAVKEHLSGAPTGTVSLTLPALSHVVSTPAQLQRVGPFAGLSGPAVATDVHVTMETSDGTETPTYAVSAVQLTQAAAHDPLKLRFTTSSLPLLDGLFQDQGGAASIPVLTLSVRPSEGGRPFTTALTYRFSGVSVGSFAENLSGSLSGTATLVIGS